jgi:hypothetical protein
LLLWNWFGLEYRVLLSQLDQYFGSWDLLSQSTCHWWILLSPGGSPFSASVDSLSFKQLSLEMKLNFWLKEQSLNSRLEDFIDSNFEYWSLERLLAQIERKNNLICLQEFDWILDLCLTLFNVGLNLSSGLKVGLGLSHYSDLNVDGLNVGDLIFGCLTAGFSKPITRLMRTNVNWSNQAKYLDALLFKLEFDLNFLENHLAHLFQSFHQINFIMSLEIKVILIFLSSKRQSQYLRTILGQSYPCLENLQAFISVIIFGLF